MGSTFLWEVLAGAVSVLGLEQVQEMVGAVCVGGGEVYRGLLGRQSTAVWVLA